MSRYIELREKIAAKAKELHAGSEALGTDNGNYVEAAKALGIKDPDRADSRAVASEMQQRVAELADLRKEFEPFKTIEDAKTVASEFERKFNKPAAGNIVPMPDGKGDDGRPLPKKSLGQLFVESSVWKAYKENGTINQSEIVPADIRATLFETGGGGGAGWAVESPGSSQVSLMPKRPITVVDFIPQVRYGEAIYTFWEETTHTDNAAEKAEAAAYAEGAFVLTKREKTIRKITNSLPVTDEQFSDVNGAEDFVNGRLEYQMRARLDLQVLAGNATPPNLEGTEAVSGIQSQALGTDTAEDAIYKLLVAIENDGFAQADAVFIRAAKWQDIRLRKTPDGVYLYGPPSAAGPDTVWGLPAIRTNAVTSTKAIAGAYRAYSLLAIKQDIEFAVGFVNDDFAKGRKTIRADIRVAMVHLRPKAFGQVTGL